MDLCFTKPDDTSLPFEGQHGPGIVNHIVNVAGLRVQPHRGRKLPYFFVELKQLILRSTDIVDLLHEFRLTGNSLGHDVQGRLHALQGVAALMGEPGHRRTDGGQPFRLRERFFGAPPFGHVLLDSDPMRDPSVGSTHRIDAQVDQVFAAVLAVVDQFAGGRLSRTQLPAQLRQDGPVGVRPLKYAR